MMTSEVTTAIAALEAQIDGRLCVRCDSDPQIVWLGGLTGEKKHGLRCGCWPEAPNLIKPTYALNRRKGELVNQSARGQGIEVAVVEGQAREIAVQAGPAAPMTIDQFKARQDLVKYVVDQMEIQVHYGVIPGTHDKSLWEPGAEYLRYAFGINWDYEIVEQREDFQTHDYYYRVRTKAYARDGSIGAAWEASAWSKERRFWCRKTCPRPCPQDHEPYGMEAGMLHHNVRDRSIKRGFVALIRNVTGTSGYFKEALAESGSADDNEVSSKPQSYRCPKHNRDWFKTEKMRRYAHPMGEGEDWCEMPASEPKPQSKAKTKATGDFANLGDLLNAVKADFDKTSGHLCEILGVPNSVAIKDFKAAYAAAEKMWGKDRPEPAQDAPPATEAATEPPTGTPTPEQDAEALYGAPGA